MVHQWYSNYSSGVGPWSEPYLDGEAPAVIPSSATDLPLEEIAAEEPDLIVGLDAGLDQQTYDRLSEVAPTIANPKGAAHYAVPYDREMQMIGDAVDRADEANQWVKDTEAAFTKARDGHPEFEGKTAAVGCPLENGGFALYPTTDPRGEFLTKLGFTVPKEVDEVAADNYYAEISAENLSMIDGYDLLLVIDDCGAPTVDLNEHLTFKSLDIAKRGDYIYPAPASDALSHNTVLSVPYALDKLIPKIEETLS
ncbi:MAG: ABC transporter substrate-binding protein [Brevibacterium sp.]|uniref:ABC transporter substrate-binding protein n=1 Tax=Brevibacterium sp. TaxID=1701 RepID=UPI0026490D31|nr:ABC transporter substrate-binding protein [Brevibacterium sp.]MDN5833226.1 ABC transporter substrate-binding protein [Brevibacterium sp.]MDN5875848.1 ABC transporter substrate-binding protein [Brevibacterium sp.]MDN5908187.1 ABC transporter substrate-binding protein [Brevibacterium sp.]MDN6122265.1 ABC transporter substrate-binding protein [Brevibacterium sp.]MDN6132833.1 ABC transporter substrate-binding protein [Brevibacterium sp.]